MTAEFVILKQFQAQDPVHKLAWNLDACFKDRGLNKKRLNDLKVNFSEYIRVDHRSGGQAQYRAKRDRNDFESSGRALRCLFDLFRNGLPPLFAEGLKYHWQT